MAATISPSSATSNALGILSVREGVIGNGWSEYTVAQP